MTSKGGILTLLGGAVIVGIAIATYGQEATDYVVQKKYKPSTGKLTPQLKESAIRWANIFRIPPSLLLALMSIESGYNPRVVNKNARAMKGKGAYGLTQLLYTTARSLTEKNSSIARKYWPQWQAQGFKPEGLLNPDIHLPIAAFGLSGNWKRYKNKPLAWLTTGVSWHQGVGNIDKQIAKGGGQVVSSNLPPLGKEYWHRLEVQQRQNPAVIAAISEERGKGATYA